MGMGPMPEVDLKRAQELANLSEGESSPGFFASHLTDQIDDFAPSPLFATSIVTEHLTLQALPNLRNLAQEIRQLTTGTSSLLTYYLTLRDAHAADAETYNAMIRDLVAGATSKFAGGGGGTGHSANGGGGLRGGSGGTTSARTSMGASISANGPGASKAGQTTSGGFVGPGGLRGGARTSLGSGANSPQRSGSPATMGPGRSPLR